MSMADYTKQAWEFVTGEHIVGEDESVHKIVKHERNIEEGIGAYVGLWLVRVDGVEQGDEVDVRYVRFEPYGVFTGRSKR